MHLATLVSVHCAQPATAVAGARWAKDPPTDQALPNPGDARPIMRRPTDLPVAAGYDTAWAQTPGLWWHSWRCSTAPLTTAPPGRPLENIFQPGRCDTKVRNSNIKNALPLMIFFCWHSKRCQLHHKWSFCSIMSFFISIKTLFSWRASVNNPPSFPPSKCIQNEFQTLLINFSKQVKQRL